MNKKKVIAALNKAIRFEHAATLQYKQHALLVRGLMRRPYADYFADQSKDAHDHAAKFGQKVVALGGLPTVEVAPVHQSTKIEEMLRQDLELEREALQAYIEAHGAADDDIALRNMLEDQIEAETRDVEELELILDRVKTGSVESVVTLEKAKG